MPTTTKQLAKIVGLSEQTIRNWTDVYSDLLTPAARGEAGTRLFADEDVQIFCTIADLRRDNVPPAEVIERLQRGDVYIEIASPQHATTPAQNDTEAHSHDLLLPVALSNMQSQMDALRADFRSLQRNQDTLFRAALVRGAIWGAVGASAVGGFYLWVLYLTMGLGR